MRSSSARAFCGVEDWLEGGGRYWLRQADRVVFELSVFEKRLSSVEGLIVLEGMVRVVKVGSCRRVDTQGMDWKGVASLVAILGVGEFSNR